MNRTKLTLGIIVILGIIALVAVSIVSNQSPESQEKPSQEAKEKTPARDATTHPVPTVGQPEEKKKDAELQPPKEEGGKEATEQDAKEKRVQDPNTPAEKKTVQDPNAPPGEKLEMVNLNNVEMKQIIKTIAEWTGKPVIPYDDAVMNQKITIYATKELPRIQALSLIYSALRARGYAPEETQDAIYLKPLSKAKYGVVPTLGFDEPLAKIIDKSQIVEKYFKIENYSPSRLQEIVTPLTAEYGNVTADDSTGILAIIDTVENLQRVEQIIKQFDVPEYGQFVTEVFKLENGDPSEIVQLIELIISNEASGRSGRGGRGDGGGSKGGEQASSVLVTSTKMPLLLIPEQRRKWIIAKGAPDDIKEVAKWVADLDKKDEVSSEQSVVQIKYVDVMEVAQAVGKTLAEMPGSQLKANIVVQPLRQARQIVVFGSEENRKIVEALIAEIDLPTSGIFDEKTFELQYADPDQIKENIDELYGGQQSSSRYYYSYRSDEKSSDTVKVISYPTAGKVTVIASPENIEKISKQIEEWDVPLNIERQPYRIIALQNSDSKQMAELLRTLFSEESARSTSFWDYYYGGGSDNKKKIVGSLYGQLSFEAVPETKKIIVISKIPEAYDVIEDLARELDRQEVAEVPKVVTLKYADSEDLCEQLNAILNETGTVATVRRTRRGLSDYNNDASPSGSNNPRTNDSNNNPDSQNSNPGEIRPWWNAGVARSEADEALPTSNLIGKVRFIPVQRSKALLVLSPPEYMHDMVTMIEELDQPGKQVMIKAVILSVGHSSVTSLGVQFSTNPFAFGELTENSVRALTELTTGFERGSFTLASGANINTLIEFLEKHANARILNQPTLWTKDNEEAVFFRGQEVAFVVSSNTSAEGTATRESVDYRPVGVTLRIRPNITPEKAVDTTINLNISQVLPEIINGNIATSKLDTTTHVIVQNGETIMLGGILFQNDSNIERKVPLLGDLPVLGGAFKHNETEVTNNELLMFITPYVVENSAEINLNRSIPVAEEGFKTLEQTQQILEDKMTGLGIDSDAEQEEDAP
jgi:general secretion pathway protein D